VRPLHASDESRWPRRAVLAAGLAALAGAFSAPAQAATESRRIGEVDEVVFAAAGDLRIEQGPSEMLTVEAEPAVLPRITTDVHGRRLLIGLAPGRIETRQPIRITLVVRSLRAFESRTMAAVSIGPLRSHELTLVLAGGGSIQLDRLEDARSLDVRISGAGDVDVRDGNVKAQRLAIHGMGTYSAPALASERADVAIDGNGEARVAASSALAVRIGGIGRVHYRGDPAVTRSISGIGSIEKD
jgi:hypothetical protein